MFAKRPIRTALACAAAVGAAVAAAAASDRPGDPPSLPGVTRPAPIVGELPEPLEAPQEGGVIRAGKWDLRISGDLSVDIGAGSLPPPRR